MIPTETLKNWLENPAAALRPAASAALRPAAQAPIAQLIATLDALGNAPTVEQVSAVVEAFLADTGWIAAWLEDMASAALQNPFFDPPLNVLNTGLQHGWVLLGHRLARMSIGVVPVDDLAWKKSQPQTERAITFSGAVTYQKLLRAGGATLAWWHATRATDAFSLAQASPCRPGKLQALADGDVLQFDGGTDSYVITRATGPIVVLQVELSVGQAPLLVEYDADTLIPVATSSTDDGASRAQMLLSFLGALGRPQDTAMIERYTHDRQFYLRWHAMRELAAVDPDRAIPRLQQMSVADEHVELRAAAAAALPIFHAPHAGDVACGA